MAFWDKFMEEEADPKPEKLKIKPIIEKIPKFEIPVEFDINLMFEDLSKTSEFKRLIYKAITGKVHRGSIEKLDKELSNLIIEFRNK